MIAGFERHVRGGAARGVAGSRQRRDFGMRAAGALVPALAHHLAIAHQHAADARIGIGGVQAAARQLERARHVTRDRRRSSQWRSLAASLGASAATPGSDSWSSVGRLAAAAAHVLDLVRGRHPRPGSCDTPRRSARRPLRPDDAAPPSPFRRSRARSTSRSPRARSWWQMRETAASMASRATGRFSSALSMPARSLASSKGTRRWSDLTTSGITSSAVSKVVKRSPQDRHSRRRRICAPSAGQARIRYLGLLMSAEGTVHVDIARMAPGAPHLP